MKQNYIRAPFVYTVFAALLLTGGSYASSIAEHRTSSHAVYATDLPSYKPLNAYGSFVVRMDRNSQVTEQAFLANVLPFFGLNESNSFQLIHTYTDDVGHTHKTYQHYVGSYAVEGQMFIVHLDPKGRLTSVNGTIINIENKKSSYSLKANVNRKPAISKEKAMNIAFKANKIKKAKTADYPVETVFVKTTDEKGLFVLAHKVRIEELNANRMVSKHVFIGVEQGTIVNEVSLIAHANVRGRGDGHYRSNLPLELKEENGKYLLVDTERKITTYSAEHTTSEWDFYGGIGEHITHTSTNFPQNPSNDIHWGLARTFDYFNEVHNRKSFDNNEGEIYAYYNPLFLDGDPDSGFPDNAFAVHSVHGNFLVFGRGSGFFNPLVTLDVVGHEFSHLVVGKNGRGGLTYQGESGALNEAFADIFGTSIEHFAVEDADWLIGKGIVNLPAYNYMRNMENPKNNHPGSRQPTTYKGQNWANTSLGARDNGGVHINSSVMNYWFYLLSVGGSGMTDPIVNQQNTVLIPAKDYIVSGIGIQKAEKIAYHTLMTQLSSNSQYVDAVNGSLTAAITLFGQDSEEYFSVYDAWYAVGLLENPRENMGLESFELTEEVFSMYPNPVTNGELTVLIKDDKGIVAFYNMAGQKVTPNFPVERGENKIYIPHLGTANYIVVFESKERKISAKIVVK